MRFFGEELDPEEVSRLLGAAPSASSRKGDVLRSGRPAQRGSWLRSARPQAPGDLDAQIVEVFRGLTEDVSVWQAMTARYRADVFCGLFMREGNEGVALSPGVVAMLAQRNVAIGFDIYSNAAEEPPCSPES